MIDPRSPDFSNTPAAARRPGFGYADRDGPDGALPVVSVVTPFFNPGAVFAETARTVLGQSLRRFEWIIVNDASTDAASLAALDAVRGLPRVRVIDLPENKGPGHARNVGFANARCEHVFQLDADDLLEPTTLEKQVWASICQPAYAFINAFLVGFGGINYMWTEGFQSLPQLTVKSPLSTHAMIRKSAFERIGGYDESITGGLEDWEFWLRAASKGFWGATIPEFQTWYRRRPSHADRWKDWDEGSRERDFLERMQAKFPDLFAGKFPYIEPMWPKTYEEVRDAPVIENPLAKRGKRLLMIVPWLRMGGADKWNLDLVEQLTSRGWEVTIAATLHASHTWLPEFARLTPDIFCLGSFLRPAEFPVFLRYLIESRQPDAVLVSNSEMGYLSLPYLRALCPGPTYLDYLHMEEPAWKNGGYPRYSVGSRDQLDFSMVTSEHLKRWMIDRGTEASRLRTVYINCDPDRWKPDAGMRRRVRAELGLPEHQTVILFAARLTAQKQPRVLGATLLELASRGSDFTALIAGDGEERPWLEAFVAEHGLGDRVKLLGEQSASRVRELMACADIFFLPSEWEGIALVLFEAMAAELAFVGADVGGQRELACEGTAMLLPRADAATEAKAYADALATLIADPEARRAMGAAAGQRIRAGFTLDRMADEFLAGLDEASALRASQPRVAVAKGFAHELAVRAVEYMRLGDQAGLLQNERDTLTAKLAALPKDPPAPPAPVPLPAQAPDPAERELADLTSSRAWKLVEMLKGTFLYRSYASLRFGDGWNQNESHETPAARLARIKSSTSYKLLQSIKSSDAYRAYAESRLKG